MNKKVIVLIIIVVLLTVFNIFQYEKTKTLNTKHQQEMDSLYKYTERLEQQVDILTDFIVDDEIERAKDILGE